MECTQQNDESVEIKPKKYVSFGPQLKVYCFMVMNAYTMTGKMRNRLDGTYTRMLRAVLGVTWKEHKTNKELYGNLPKITDTLMIRRLRSIGH